MKIPEDNPFRDTIIDLAADGHSWSEIWEKIEEAYNPVDHAAFEEKRDSETAEAMSDGTCEKCGVSNWTTDARYGRLCCADCGWQPRDNKEKEILEALERRPDSAQKRTPEEL